MSPVPLSHVRARMRFALRKIGTPVEFTSESSGSYDETLGTWSGSGKTTVAGYATAAKTDVENYRELTLTRKEVITLDFVPDLDGEKPEPGYNVTWGGNVYAVDAVDDVALAGTHMTSRVVVSR